MEKRPAFWTLGELADLFGGELRGNPDVRIVRPAPANGNDPEGLAFAGDAAYLELAVRSGVGAVLVPREAPEIAKPAIAVDRPRETFGRFLAMNDRPLPIQPGVDERAWVSPDAEIDPTASVGPFAVVERGVRLGPRVRVYPFAYVGEDCVLEEDCCVYPHAVLVQDVHLKPRTVLQSGAVVGADGFGFVWDGQRQVKVPQVGGVVLGPDVEIGALSAVDRATAGRTVVGQGTKVDNFVQIGHNCTVGEHNVMASFVGISGSTTIGDRNVFAGQAASNDHVTIGSDIVFGGRTGIVADVLDSGKYWGLPAKSFREEVRLQAAMKKLPDALKQIAELERRIAELEEKV